MIVPLQVLGDGDAVTVLFKSLVITSSNFGFLWNGDYGGAFEA